MDVGSYPCLVQNAKKYALCLGVRISAKMKSTKNRLRSGRLISILKMNCGFQSRRLSLILTKYLKTCSTNSRTWLLGLHLLNKYVRG